MKKYNLIFFLGVLLLLSFSIPSWSASVKLTVDMGRGHRSVEVNDLFYIYMDVADIDAVPETPGKVAGAKVMYFERTGSSSSFTSINGKTTQSSSYRYTLTLKALKEGTFSFGPVSVGGVKSNSVSYTIGGSSASTSPQGSSGADPRGIDPRTQPDDKPKYIGKGDGNLFLKASVTQSSVYEQQALVYTVKLYTTYEAIKFIGATAAPKFDGFVVEESKDISSSLSYETYNGKTYATAIIARYIIFPQITGQLKVTGNTYTVSVDQREYYHDPFWGSLSYSTPLQLNVTPNDLTVNVKPLPSPKPADFSGGVGKFSFSSELKRENFKSNVAASIVYTVKGQGNLKYIQLPDLNTIYPAELEVYTPKTDIKTSVGSSNVSGEVTFDYSFMPLEEGDFKIPQIRLVYFNPESGNYETAIAKGYDIKVGKGIASDKSQVNKRLRFEDGLKEVKFSKLKIPGKPNIYGFPYWLLYVIPVILLVGSIIFVRIYTDRHADMVAFNSRRADKIASKRFKHANLCMKKNDVSGFYTELLRALWGYMGDKLKMPTSELLRDNIRQKMESKGVNEEAINEFVDILDKCEFAKYSPEGGKQDMPAVYRDAVKVIDNVEKSMSKKG